jgi:hypothetical protein
MNNSFLYKIEAINSGYDISGYNYSDFSKYPLLVSTELAIEYQINNNILKKINYTLSKGCIGNNKNDINLRINNIIYWRIKKMNKV